jgi:glycerol-3-phosphate acyltransferase PlsY
MMAGLSFPIFLNVMLGNTNPILTGFSVIVALILIITHRKNIQRIIKKEESKITFFSAKDK